MRYEMSSEKVIKIPDLGGVEGVDVIEVLISPGDKIKKDDSLITLESDKASMDVPSPEDGVVVAVKCKVGDKVSEGDDLLVINVESNVAAKKAAAPKASNKEAPVEKAAAVVKTVVIPDLGGADSVEVIEIFVSAGEKINKDDSLITLESDKASMEVPSPYKGEVEDLKIAIGDKVSENDAILTLKVKEDTVEKLELPKKPQPTKSQQEEQRQEIETAIEQPTLDQADVYAGPAVRRIAREFGVDLTKVNGTGQKGRILKEDVQLFVKQSLQAQGGQAAGLAIAPAEAIDFSKFGQIEKQPLNKIKQLTATNVHRSWVSIPHVTQFDQADITDLEAFRKSQKSVAEKEGIRLTILAFIVKAITQVLRIYPQFNSSLDVDGQNLIVKRYYNIGIAVDTPNGLVVPVIRDTDQMGVFEIARAMADLSERARKKRLKPQDMQGGCFTISSLGGIGGVAFTPIINAPEVAILGISRAAHQPIYKDGSFIPRLILPFALSYDHRVIDGAEAVRFSSTLAEHIADVRKILL